MSYPCHVTGGCRTTFESEESFWSICVARVTDYQDRRGNKLPPACLDCRREKIPPEVDIKEMKKEHAMIMEKKICGLCEKPAGTLVKHFGKDVCSSCKIRRSFIKNNPEKVVEVIREFYNLVGFLTPEEKVSAASGTSDEAGKLQGIVLELEKKLAKAKMKAEEREKAIAELKDENLYLAKMVDELPPMEEKGNGEIEKVAWDLALGSLRGTVQGVSAEQIEAIKGIGRA